MTLLEKVIAELGNAGTANCCPGCIALIRVLDTLTPPLAVPDPTPPPADQVPG